MGSLCADTNNGGGIVGDGAVVEGQAGGANKHCIAMVGHVPHSICEDTHERMDPPKEIKGDHHEEGEECFLDQLKIIIRGFPFKRGEGIVRLLK